MGADANQRLRDGTYKKEIEALGVRTVIFGPPFSFLLISHIIPRYLASHPSSNLQPPLYIRSFPTHSFSFRSPPRRAAFSSITLIPKTPSQSTAYRLRNDAHPETDHLLLPSLGPSCYLRSPGQATGWVASGQQLCERGASGFDV